MSFLSNWKFGESAVGAWLAGTVTGTIVKTAIAPVLLWIGDTAGDWDLPAWLIIAIVGAVPTAINALNSADTRYGVGSE